MKARKILDWMLDYNLNGEDLNKVEISKSDDFLSQSDFIERCFGCVPDKEIPDGEYLYVYEDVLPIDFYVLNFLDDADLVLKSSEGYKIYLFRIED
jgi:hypothetical protein